MVDCIYWHNNSSSFGNGNSIDDARPVAISISSARQQPITSFGHLSIH